MRRVAARALSDRDVLYLDLHEITSEQMSADATRITELEAQRDNLIVTMQENSLLNQGFKQDPEDGVWKNREWELEAQLREHGGHTLCCAAHPVHNVGLVGSDVVTKCSPDCGWAEIEGGLS